MKISLIAAMSKNRVIGYKGRIPWKMPADMEYFKKNTDGKPVVMGRKTYDSLPNKPLPNRTNIIITRDQHYDAEGCIVVHSTEEAKIEAEKLNSEELMIIGGSEIYKEFLNTADQIYLTVIDTEIKGDAFFPELSNDWKEVLREDKEKDEKNMFDYSFIILSKK